MKMERKSIKTKVTALLAIILCLVCAGLGIISYTVAAATVLGEVEGRLLEKANDVAELVKSRILYHFQAMESIANRSEVRSMDWETQLPALQQEAVRMGYNTFGVSDLQGNLRLVASDAVIDISDRAYFKEIMHTHATTVSQPIISRDDGTLVNAIVTPIKDENQQMQGVLLSIMEGQILINMVTQACFGESGYAYMINETGTFLAHDDLDLVLDQVNLIEAAKTDPEYIPLAAILTRMTRGERGTGEYPFRGSTRYIGYAPVPGLGWSVAVGSVKAEMLAGLTRLRGIIILVSLVALLLSVAIGAKIMAKIVSPIKTTSALLQVIASGDLTGTVPEKYLRMESEVGDLSRNIKHMGEALRNIFSKLKTDAQRISASGENLAASSQQMNASLEEVAASANHFSDNARQLGENASQMAEMGEAASKQARAGNSAVANNVAQMEQINNMVNNLKEVVTHLGNRTQDISKIVTTIKSIADQTNMLALNAAIESARAGEHGRGFSVVADEVRKLAEQSAASASEITDLVAEVETQIHEIVREMDKGVEQVQHSTAEVNATGEVLTSILANIEKITDRIETVSAASQGIGSGSEEISASIQEQTATMAEVSNAAIELQHLVGELEEILGRYKF